MEERVLFQKEQVLSEHERLTGCVAVDVVVSSSLVMKVGMWETGMPPFTLLTSIFACTESQRDGLRGRETNYH